jgi:2-polyprenyl-3-methyl-5-hydroxy-6-metoxy-1,4-benzoquinol methylase
MNDNPKAENTFEHDSHKEFVEYYAKESLSEESLNRMKGIFHCINRNLSVSQMNRKLNVADIGCGAGVLSSLWAQQGHNVYGLDVNEPLIELAKQRAKEAGLSIKYYLGSATHLPWENESMDICIAPELLEHIVEWEACINEFARILKPNGILYISTANKLCPKQQEFSLPFYSWYPTKLKRHFEHLARTTRPEIAGYAKYPAVNWFSYYQLREEFSKLGMDSYDRFDIMDTDNKPNYQKHIINLITQSSILRWLGHVATPGLTMLAIKKQ